MHSIEDWANQKAVLVYFIEYCAFSMHNFGDCANQESCIGPLKKVIAFLRKSCLIRIIQFVNDTGLKRVWVHVQMHACTYVCL